MTAVAYSIALPASRGVLTPQAYSAQAEAFFARLATQPAQARKQLYDTMIRALAGAGVWSKLDLLYVFAAADQATALTNLVSSSCGATAVNAPGFTVDRGFTGAASKYIDSNFNPSTAVSPRYTLNSASLGGWSLTGGGVAGPIAGNKAAGLSFVYPKFTDGKNYAEVNAATFLNTTGAIASGLGLFTATRTDSANAATYQNMTTLVSAANASSSMPNGSQAFLYGDLGSYAAGLQIAAGFIGGGLSAADVTALYNALHAYLQAVAGVA